MATLSNFTEVGLIDTRINAGTVTLPLTTTIPFRTLTFKDIYGNFSRRTFTLNTQGSDRFEDGASSKTFSNDFAFIQIYAGGANQWYILNGTTTTSQVVSSIATSTITGEGSGLRNLPAVSTLSLQSTVQGLGTAGYISTSQLFSTVTGVLTGNITVANIQSTVQGLGTIGYISSTQLFSTVSGIGSGFTGSTNALSAGTVTASLISSLRINTSSIQASNASFSSVITDSIQIGSGLGFLQLPPLQVTSVSSITSFTNQAFINSTFLGNASAQTAIQFFGLTGQYTNTVIEEQSTGVGTQELLLFKGSSISDRIRLATTGNLVFEPGIAAQSFLNNIAVATPAMIINTSSNVGILTATPATPLDVAGIARAQTLSSLALTTSSINGSAFGQPASTVSLFTSNTSNFASNILQNWSTAVSTTALFTSNTSNFFAPTLSNNLSSGLSTTALFTSNTSNFAVNTSNFAANILQNWSTAVSTTALFTSNTSNFTTNTSNFAANILQNWSTAVSTTALFTSNTSNWTNNILLTHNISSAASSVALFTSNTSNFAANILQNWSTAVSTTALFTSNTSNFAFNILQNWSTAVSTVALFASNTGFTGSTTQLSAAIIRVSSLSSAFIYSQQAVLSSLQVDSLQIGSGTGYIDIGPIQSVEVSSLQVNTGILYASNTFLGTVSSQTAVQMFGLNGSYQNTVIAERSTGTTSQELILFKGSSTSDQIRLQTTGNFLIETGVAARTFPNMGQVTTPTLFANTSGQVAIGANTTAGYTLNVAGTGFFATFVSTPILYAGTIHYTVAFV